MSIHRRVMTQPCGQRATALRVAPQPPPYCGARLDHRCLWRCGARPCLTAAAEATRLAWLAVNRPTASKRHRRRTLALLHAQRSVAAPLPYPAVDLDAE